MSVNFKSNPNSSPLNFGNLSKFDSSKLDTNTFKIKTPDSDTSKFDSGKTNFSPANQASVKNLFDSDNLKTGKNSNLDHTVRGWKIDKDDSQNSKDVSKNPDRFLSEKRNFNDAEILRFKLQNRLTEFGAKSSNVKFKVEDGDLMLQDGKRKHDVEVRKNGKLVVGEGDDQITFEIKKNNKLKVDFGKEEMMVKLSKEQAGVLKNVIYRPAEMGMAALSPVQAVIGRNAANRATDQANRFFQGLMRGTDNNEQNAFKHAYWNALMVREFANYSRDTSLSPEVPAWGSNVLNGAAWAQAFATAHEIDFPGNSGNTPAQREMDLYNNRVGREIAIRILTANPNASEAELAQAIMDALNNGQLRVINPELQNQRPGF